MNKKIANVLGVVGIVCLVVNVFITSYWFISDLMVR